MATETNGEKISLEELMVSTLATTDALAKLMIARRNHEDEFKAQLTRAEPSCLHFGIKTLAASEPAKSFLHNCACSVIFITPVVSIWLRCSTISNYVRFNDGRGSNEESLSIRVCRFLNLFHDQLSGICSR